MTGRGDAGKTASGESIILAILLFLFGEKSLTLAKLSMHSFHDIVDGKQVQAKYIYEISLYGLMIGACVVVVISILRRHSLKNDSLTILTGVITATLAAVLNIGDAMTAPDAWKYDDIPLRAMFFLVIWFLLVLVPGFTRVFLKSESDEIDIALLGKIIASLLIAVIVGAVLRAAITPILRDGLALGAIDVMRFRPDSLVQLSSVWIVATFATFQGKRRLAWRCAYVALAPVAGFTYAFFISKPDGDPSQGVSAMRMALCFASLSLAGILPAAPFARGVLTGSWKATLYASAAVFATCAAAMFFGAADTSNLQTADRIAISLLQGLAGGLAPVCACLGVALVAWRYAAPGGRRSLK